ncbi:MAG: nucleotide exchange factor GrpE [Gloeocapsa sp. DLM2.Bin57]|nr:MAG: nucleotide exchange factor GrpE [Gloeocapsa sp. DLM2.Bin57]
MAEYKISAEEKLKLEQEIADLYKHKSTLIQQIREQKQQHQAQNEELFIDILEVFDSLEFLINYLQENPELTPQALKRLPKSVQSIQKKLLLLLAKRKVNKIEFTQAKPDFNFCQVIDQEIRDDIEEHNITKITRQGFDYDGKILRPVEVIVAKSSDTDTVTQGGDFSSK